MDNSATSEGLPLSGDSVSLSNSLLHLSLLIYTPITSLFHIWYKYLLALLNCQCLSRGLEHGSLIRSLQIIFILIGWAGVMFWGTTLRVLMPKLVIVYYKAGVIITEPPAICMFHVHLSTSLSAYPIELQLVGLDWFNDWTNLVCYMIQIVAFWTAHAPDSSFISALFSPDLSFHSPPLTSLRPHTRRTKDQISTAARPHICLQIIGYDPYL